MTQLEQFPKFSPPSMKACVIGDVGHNDIDAGAPVKVGGVASATGTVPGVVADGDRVQALFDEYGRQRVIVDAMAGPLVTSTFTLAASGTTQYTGFPVSKFAIMVTKTGAITSWTVNLEGSLNGSTFTTLVSHTNAAPGDGLTTFTIDKPVLYWRLTCSAIVLGGGTNIIARGIAMQ